MGGDPSSQFELPYGVTIINGYAMTAHRHMHEYGTTAEQLAEIAVTMRLHASMNPHAKYRDPITVEDVLKSRVISSPLHLLDCCVVSDGAGAVVMTSAERARDLRKKPVYVLGSGEGMRHNAAGHRNLLDIATNDSGRLAYQRAGPDAKRYRHGDDLRLVHDHRHDAVGGAGFLQARRGRRVRQRRAAALRPRVPGQHRRRRAVKQPSGDARDLPLIESTKQLRGEGGPRQAKKPLTTAMVSGIGGNLGYRHAAASLILSNQ